MNETNRAKLDDQFIQSTNHDLDLDSSLEGIVVVNTNSFEQAIIDRLSTEDSDLSNSSDFIKSLNTRDHAVYKTLVNRYQTNPVKFKEELNIMINSYLSTLYNFIRKPFNILERVILFDVFTIRIERNRIKRTITKCLDQLNNPDLTSSQCNKSVYYKIRYQQLCILFRNHTIGSLRRYFELIFIEPAIKAFKQGEIFEDLDENSGTEHTPEKIYAADKKSIMSNKKLFEKHDNQKLEDLNTQLKDYYSNNRTHAKKLNESY